MTDPIQLPDTKHAVRGPSSAARHMSCPASAVLEQYEENKSSIYAATGTVGHEIAAEILAEFIRTGATDMPNAESYVGRKYQLEGFDIEVDMDLADTINDYCAHVWTLIDPAAGDHLLIEQAVPVGSYTLEEGATGTADVIGLIDGGRELIVADLKTGHGHQVNAEENPQLTLYGLGSLEHVELIYPNIERVRLVIIQPPKRHFDEYHMTVEELREKGEDYKDAYYRADMANSAFGDGGVETMIKEDFFNPTSENCHFCRFKNKCPARGLAVESVVTEASGLDEFEDLTEDTKIEVTDDTDKLGEYMRVVPMIEEWCADVRSMVYEKLANGDEVDGFKLVAGRKGNRSWTDEDQVAEQLKSSRIPRSKCYNEKLMTPTQMEKALRDKPKVWEKLDELTTQADGRPTMAAEDDPRPAFTVGDDVDEFEEISSADDLIG